jgi:hypothetical protein
MYFWRPVLDETLGRSISIHTVMDEWTGLQLVQSHHLMDRLDRARDEITKSLPPRVR